MIRGYPYFYMPHSIFNVLCRKKHGETHGDFSSMSSIPDKHDTFYTFKMDENQPVV